MGSSHPIRSRLVVGGGVLILALSSVAFISAPVQNHLRAAALLLRIANPDHKNTLANYSTHSVAESDVTVGTSNGIIRARLYLPQGVNSPPGMVMVVGVHHLGINEPRLVNFARAFAAAGVAVLTPEPPEIADYRITPQTIEVIGRSAQELSHRLAKARVGVLGFSFSGGLALLAAADPEFAPQISFVIAVGAHDDLSRVSRFFVNNQIFRPDGSLEKLQAHNYGGLVLVYSHLEDFFAPADVTDARRALRALLYEDGPAARAALQQMHPAARAKMQLLFEDNIAALSGELLRDIDKHHAEMEAVSPAGKLSHLRADVLLLHGSGDNIIPASETLWLATEVPKARLKDALITPVLSHVDMENGPSVADRARVVHFIAQMLEEARESNHAVNTDTSGGGIGGDFYFFPKDEPILPWASEWSR
jgi:pimeloyl-ACP methyl ester carboxylesterase